MRIVATGLCTVPSAQLTTFIRDYMAHETVDAVVVGHPRDMQGHDSESMRYITPALQRLRREFPGLDIRLYDERFTSVLAHRAMIDSGMKKSDRRDKATVDTMAAAIILNDYLQSQSYQNP